MIDENVISLVFDKKNSQHERFKPVYKWVVQGDGSVIWGGTKYLEELRKSARYLGVFLELQKQRRAVRMPTAAVDARATAVKALVADDDFDDEHIVALVGISRCRLVATDDTRSLPFVRRRDLYPDGVEAPCVYRYPRDVKHCCSRFIVAACPKRTTGRGTKKPKSRPVVEVNI